MMRKLLLALAILATLTGPVWATAWTENKTTVGIVTAVPADTSTAYNMGTSFPNGVYLTSIQFVPSQAADVLVVRNGSATGPIIAKFYSVDGGPQVKYFGGKRVFRPYILNTDNTIGGTATNAMVIFEYGNAP